MSTPVLYELIGPNFKMPVLVQWHDMVAQVDYDARVAMMAIQHESVQKWLLKNGAEERDGSFWIAYEHSKEVLVPSLFGNPEEIVEWTPMREVKEGERISVDPFVDGYCKSDFCIVRDEMLAWLIWNSFCKYALHRLLNEQEIVPLLFADILPLQMRRNWKEVAVDYDFKYSKQGKFNPDPQSIIDRGVVNVMCHETITGVRFGKNGSKLANWMLEIVPNDAFAKMALQLEQVKRSREKGVYQSGVYDQLKRQLPTAIQAYASFLQEASQSGLRFPFSYQQRVEGVSRTEPVDQGKLFKNPIVLKGNIPIHIHAVDECSEKPVEKADEVLHGVPDL